MDASELTPRFFQDTPASSTPATERAEPQFAMGLTLQILYLIRHILHKFHLRQGPGVENFSTTVLKSDEITSD